MIHHLGTFDVENYGDLLYPIVLGHCLKDTELRQYSLLPGDAPLDAGFRTHAIRSLFHEPQKRPMTLVVGGGDLLRTDWNLIARHYGRHSRVSFKGLQNSIGTAGAFGYALADYLPRLEPGGFYAKRFRARWMDYPAAGPFLINTENLPPRSAVAYVSCGAPHDFGTDETGEIKRIFEQARYIYLRDEESAERLRNVGVRRDLNVAPDLTVTLSDQFEYEEQSCRGRELLSRFGVRPDMRVLCFQSQPYPGFFEDDILQQLKHYQERTGTEIVALPLGYCHGDHEFLQSLATRSPRLVKYADVYSVFDMLAIIAASDLFVGTSLHGNITAFSYGIPHVFGPLPVDKATGFLNVVNLPGELKMRAWTEMNDKIDFAIELGGDYFSNKAIAAKAKTYKTIAELKYEK